MIQPAALSRTNVAGPLALAPVGDGATFDLSFANIVDATAVVAATPAVAGQPAAVPGNALPSAITTPVVDGTPNPAMPVSNVPTAPTPVRVDPVAATLAPIAQALAAVAEAMPGDPAPPPPALPPVPMPMPQAVVRSRQAAPASAVPARGKDQTPSPEPADDDPVGNGATPPALPDMPAQPLSLPVAIQVSASPDAIAAMIVHAPVAPTKTDKPQPVIASVPRAAVAASMPLAHDAAIEGNAVGATPPIVDAKAPPPVLSPVAPAPIAAAMPTPDIVNRDTSAPAAPPRVTERSVNPSPTRSVVPPQTPVVADVVPIGTAAVPERTNARALNEQAPTPGAITDAVAIDTANATGPAGGTRRQEPTLETRIVADAAVVPDHVATIVRDEQASSLEEPVVEERGGSSGRPAIATPSGPIATTEFADRPASPQPMPIDPTQLPAPSVAGPAVASVPVPDAGIALTDRGARQLTQPIAVPSPVSRTVTAGSDAPPIMAQPIGFPPAPTPETSLAPVVPAATPPTAALAPQVAGPAAESVDPKPPATERTTPTPVARAEQFVVAMPTPAIVAGTTAPAFRMFAQAIHDARRDDTSVDPLAAAPIAAIEQPRVASPVGAAHGGTLDLSDHRWPHAMVDRIERLRDAASAAADAADTSIRLIPDALGTIDVSVRRDGDTVHVRFTAEQAATRALLTEAQPKLAELAEAKGMKLWQANVDAGASGQHQRQPQTPQSRFDAPTRVGMGVRTEDSTLETTRIA